MADLLNIAAISANTFKKAIEVTSQNVANVSTAGYHRQVANIISNTPQIAGASNIGSGSRVDQVKRIYDNAMQQQLTSSYSLKSRYEEQLQQSKQIEGVVASNTQGVQTFMQSFFDAAQNLANDPTSDVNRRLMINDSTSLQSYIGNMAQVLKETNGQVNAQLDTIVSDANAKIKAIYDANQVVANANKTGAHVPNELLDKRDQAIYSLGQLVGVKTYSQPDGSVSVYLGNGQIPLVSQNSMSQLQSNYSEYSNENRKEIFMNVGGENRQISDKIVQGKIGATLDNRANALDKSRNELGVAINGLVAGTNWQHYQGWDLNGKAGKDFFQPLSTTAMGSNKNTGSEDGTNIKITFTPPKPAGVTSTPPYDGTAGHTQPTTYGDKENALKNATTAIGQLKAREYEIVSNGGNPATFNFKDYKTGQDITASAVETPANSGKYQLDGLQFDLSAIRTSGTSNNKDHYIVKPQQAILEQFKTVISDTSTIATRGQSPIDTNNNGSILDETPAAAAYGDNVNIANIANLSGKKILYSDVNNQSSTTLLGGYAKMASNIGLYVKSTNTQLQTQTNVFNNAYARSQSLSGVNLDEEAANLMKYQQAYQASAKLISTTQQMFTTLLQTIR